MNNQMSVYFWITEIQRTFLFKNFSQRADISQILKQQDNKIRNMIKLILDAAALSEFPIKWILKTIFNYL